MNINHQDLTAIINPTSRHGLGYDSVHVETLLVTDGTLPLDMSWYVPAGVSVPPEALALINGVNVPMYPITETNLMAGTEDIQKQAIEGNTQDVLSDAAKLLMRSIMKKTSLTPLAGSTKVYSVAYDYKLFPINREQPNVFEFKFILPFDGLALNPNGGQVQASVITPIGAKIDTGITLGKAENGSEISESLYEIPSVGRQLVSFYYKQDPSFVIRYMY